MRKSKFFRRGRVPQGTPAVETAPATEPKIDYESKFLKRQVFKARKSVYISRESHALVVRLVHMLAMAGKEISVGGYIDNVMAEHLESHRELIAEMRRQQLEQD